MLNCGIAALFLFAAATAAGWAMVRTATWKLGAANPKWTEIGTDLYSPRWPEAFVVSAAVTLSCSTNAPKESMAISFLKDGVTIAGPIRIEPVSAVGVAEKHSYDIGETRGANGVCLRCPSEWKAHEVALDLVGSKEKVRWFPPRGMMVEVR